MAEEIFYNDLSLNPTVNSQGDLSSVTNREAIKQSLRMMMDTSRGSRVFSPDYGCRVKAFLFEPFETSTAERLGREIRETIQNYEKRVQLVTINVEMDWDATSYVVNIVYRIINTEQVDAFKVTLEKL